MGRLYPIKYYMGDGIICSYVLHLAYRFEINCYFELRIQILESFLIENFHPKMMCQTTPKCDWTELIEFKISVPILLNVLLGDAKR